MRTLKTSEAATLLNVSPNTLRAWERRFGFPMPQRSPGKHRLYAYAEVIALRDALQEGLSISSAVSVAREAFGANAHALLSALSSFRTSRADEAMEGSLALRSVEPTIEEVLLPALDAIRRRKGGTSAAWAFSLAWSSDWLLRARRLAPLASVRGSLLIGDATDPPLDPAIPYVHALGLCCVRSGIEVLSLPVQASRRLSEATGAIDPDVVVIAGAQVSDDDVARWAYQVGASAGRVPFLLFHRAIDPLDAGSRAQLLPHSPLGARARLTEVLATRDGFGSEIDAEPPRRAAALLSGARP